MCGKDDMFVAKTWLRDGVVSTTKILQFLKINVWKENDGPGTVFAVPGPPGLQTARKPNSVLDDHSSTRRITAAL
jgi:hypothetical protein